MGFVEAIQVCFSKYFDFSGRARRSEYWWFYLFLFIGGVVLGILDIVLFGINGTGILGIIFSLVTFIPILAAAARRLHDTNRSGWWQLVPAIGGAIVGFGAISALQGGSSSILLIGVLVTLALMILLIVWLATDGDQGENRFGPNPKGPVSVAPKIMPNRSPTNKRLFD